MAGIHSYYAVYELQGDSAVAAWALAGLEQELMEKNPVRIHHKNRSMHPRDSNLMHREVMGDIIKRRFGLVKTLGLHIPAVQIEQHTGGHPRAYNHYPHVVSSDNPERFFMLCPIDYKGEHHVPDNATPVPEDKIYTTDFGDLVHRELGYLSPPLLMQNKAGTALPADFDPSKHNVSLRGIEGHTYKVFIAGGTSLSSARQYLQRMEEYEAAKKILAAEVERLMPTLELKELLGADPGDIFEARCHFREENGKKPEIWVHLTNKSRNGASVAFKDNKLCITEDYSQGSFLIRPNNETPEGQKLGRLFDKVLTKPDIGQYWLLWNPSAPGLKGQFHSHSKEGDKAPKIDTVRGVHYLVYLIDANAPKDHCNPPGSIPVNLAEYLWLKADIEDEDMMIRPPEPPAQLAHMRPVKTGGAGALTAFPAKAGIPEVPAFAGKAILEYNDSMQRNVWPDDFSLDDDPETAAKVRAFIGEQMAALKAFDARREAWVEENLPSSYHMTYYFHDHAHRVAEDMRKTAKHMGLSDVAAENLYLAMLPHDIGKNLLPPHIWDTIEKPENDLKTLRRSHTELGVNAVDKGLAGLTHPFIGLMKDIMLNHHEQMDGGGFLGKKGDELSAPVRLACIIKSFDGYSIARPHFGKRDISTSGVLDRMRNSKGAAIYDMELFEAYAAMKLSGPEA